METGKRIAILRHSKGLTQKDLADMIGTSKNHIASIEMGKRKAHITTLALIAHALGVDLKTLLKNE